MKKMIKLSITFIFVFALLSSSLFVNNSASLAAPKKPKLNVKKVNMSVGGTFQLRTYNLKKKYKATYSSSNENVAVISTEDNKQKRVGINAVSVGTSTITVTIKKGKKVIRTLKCKVKVAPSAASIKFIKKQVNLTLGRKTRLETIIKPNTSLEQPVFESDNTAVATVNSRGIIYGIAPGTVTITATLLSCNLSATCTVTVRGPGID